MAETLLIVDDEDSVRRTFEEWLTGDFPETRVRSAADAASALKVARDEPVDLAILDWNLGGGHNGLQLLEDLQVFRPELVAILVTGYASQATPLQALRMGVRDYFDKSRDLSRTAMRQAVEKQLRLIRPLKHERVVREQLSRFQAAAEEALSYVQASGQAPGADAFAQTVRQALSFLKVVTQSGEAHLVWRVLRGSDSNEHRRRFCATGESSDEPEPPFGQTLAAAALQGPGNCLLVDLAAAQSGWNLKLAPEERRHRQALALALRLDGEVTAIVELFDKPGGFTESEQKLLNAAAPWLADLLRLAASRQETQRLLLEALEAALAAGRTVEGTAAEVSAELRASVTRSLESSALRGLESQDALALAEHLKMLGQRHGSSALRRALSIVNELRRMLDEQQGLEAPA